MLDALVAAELDGSNGSPRNAIELDRLAELPPALRRLVVQQLADRAAGRPVAGAARHAEEVGGAAPHRHRDARPRRRRPRRSPSAACLRAER